MNRSHLDVFLGPSVALVDRFRARPQIRCPHGLETLVLTLLVVTGLFLDVDVHLVVLEGLLLLAVGATETRLVLTSCIRTLEHVYLLFHHLDFLLQVQILASDAVYLELCAFLHVYFVLKIISFN